MDPPIKQLAKFFQKYSTNNNDIVEMLGMIIKIIVNPVIILRVLNDVSKHLRDKFPFTPIRTLLSVDVNGESISLDSNVPIKTLYHYKQSILSKVNILIREANEQLSVLRKVFSTIVVIYLWICSR